MKDGFIKVCAATPEIKVADCAYNLTQIKHVFDKAVAEKVNILVLPELCVTGSTCGDLFLHDTLLDGAKNALCELARYTAGNKTLVAVGVPICKANRLYSCAALLRNGMIRGIVPKMHLSDAQKRQFVSAEYMSDEIDICGSKYPFGTEFVFDAEYFSVGVELGEDAFASISPSSYLDGADIILNLSADAEEVGRANYRETIIKAQSARLSCGYVFANAGKGESTTDLVFAGRNIIAENGEVLIKTKAFEEAFAVSEIDVSRLRFERKKVKSETANAVTIKIETDCEETALTRNFARLPFVPACEGEREERCETILGIQANALAARLAHTGAKACVIGLSGGLDSCLAALVCARALKLLGRDPKELVAITMPCFGTTKRTKSNAQRLAECLGATFKTVNIAKAVKQHFADIGHDINTLDVTYENSQARERTQVLMDIANKCGGLVIGTGDLSELALGWATYNGDHMSMYAVNSGIPKTLIRHIVNYVAENSEAELKNVLLDILDTPVSPELLPADEKGEIAQKTEDLVGPYELHDFFIYNTVRYGFSPKKIFRLANIAFDGKYDKITIKKWLTVFAKRFITQQFKRSCLPDGVKVGSVGLSPRGDWLMPSDASYKIWLKEIENL